MAKRIRGYKSLKCPEPINTMLDLAAALTLGLYTKHKIKKDFENGEGEESVKAAGMVFSLGSMRNDSRIIMNLGGLIGLNSALKDVERKMIARSIPTDLPYADKVSDDPVAAVPHVKRYLWRNHCEDGAAYGLDPSNYETADEYNDALVEAKQNCSQKVGTKESMPVGVNIKRDVTDKKYTWSKYCEDGSEYGLNPDDYETADDYEDALSRTKSKK